MNIHSIGTLASVNQANLKAKNASVRNNFSNERVDSFNSEALTIDDLADDIRKYTKRAW